MASGNPLVPPAIAARERVERFRRDLGLVAGGDPHRLGMAVSGGPDSLALLILAAAALPGAVHAFTVDHGLRPESAAEACHVADICARLCVPHEILAVTVERRGEGLQGDARKARYQALAGAAAAAGIAFLATAHHADDQAETILMRLRRGSGVAGLAGIRPARQVEGVTIVRPLLGWRKAELATIVAETGLIAADDSSNRNPRFDRTAVRRLLAEHPELDSDRLARSAATLRDADSALEWVADRLWRERVAEHVDGSLAFRHGELPVELKRRLLVRILQTLAPAGRPRGREVADLLARLETGSIATLCGLRCEGGDSWRFAPAAPHARRAASSRGVQ